MKTGIKYRRAIIVFLTLAIAALPAAAAEQAAFKAAAQSLHVPDLVEKASAYNGAGVTVVGEIIGDVMARGDHVWLNLLDSGTAVGIWVEKSLLPEITFVGNYGVLGDRVSVTGIMHRACPEHGGDLDIHAESIALVRRGEIISHPVDTSRIIAAVALSVSGILLASLWRKSEGQKKIL